MATYRRRHGCWTVAVRRKGYPAQYNTFDKKSEAEDWAKDVEIKMKRRAFVDTTSSEKTILKTLLTRYSDDVSVTKKGAVAEQSKINMICKHPFALKTLTQIDGADIATYREDRMKGYQDIKQNNVTPVGEKTTREEMQIISHAFKIAKSEWGFNLPIGNPCADVSKPPANKGARDRRLKTHTDKSLCEEILLLEHAKEFGNNMESVIIFAIETAMRRGELSGLEWKYVDLDIRIAHLPKTKNGKKRDVPLSTTATEILRKLKNDADENDHSVFGLLPDFITHSFINICKNANITDLKFHDLRHEATSRLFELGLNPFQVAAITGHGDMQSLKRYTHLKGVDLVKELL
jgi:integrase